MQRHLKLYTADFLQIIIKRNFASSKTKGKNNINNIDNETIVVNYCIGNRNENYYDNNQ
jgi:hypothetical protein